MHARYMTFSSSWRSRDTARLSLSSSNEAMVEARIIGDIHEHAASLRIRVYVRTAA